MGDAEKKPATVTIKLDFPIEWAEGGSGEKKEITEVVLKRPKGRHIKQFGRDMKMETLAQVAAKISGYPTPFFDELDAQDYIKVVEAVSDFLVSGPEIGKSF